MTCPVVGCSYSIRSQSNITAIPRAAGVLFVDFLPGEQSRMAEAAEKTAMVVALDDSEHSFYALQWTLRHFFSHASASGFLVKLVVVHAKPSPTSVIGVAGPGAADVVPFVESDLRKMSLRVIEKAKHLCTAKSVADVEYEIVDGDPRNVLCEAVERHQADMLVMGSHGYGVIKRAVLGSVSDYCAHHARCTVMIIKKPTLNH